jgi:phospholipase/lecithinase/hemolysin
MRLPLLHRLIAVAVIGFAGSASAYSDLFVFGDSLSDGGNVALLIGADPDQVITGNTYVPSQPYASGTFSNGPTWVDGLAAHLGVGTGPSLAGGSNYAFGGAQTRDGDSPSLITQVGMFLGNVGGVAPSDALYVIAGGGNNARAALEDVLAGAPIGRTVLATAVKFAIDVGNMVDDLQAAGASDIVVWNAPNLGLAPAVTASGPAGSFLGQVLGQVMNAALARRLQDEAGVQIFDLYGLVGSVVADPAAYGMVNVSDACGALPNCTPESFLFWDGIHPTSGGQALIADAMIAAVVPEPGTWAMFVAGGLLLALRRRRA